MLRITKKVFNNIKSPKYIVFNGFVKTSFIDVHNETKHKITFFDKDMQDIMSYSEIQKLYEKYNRKNELQDYEKMANSITTEIVDNLKIYPIDMQKVFINEIATTTYFKRYFEDYNITNLIRKYKLEPGEIFSFLVQPHKKFNNNSGFYAKYNQYLDYYVKEFDKIKNKSENINQNYIYFDYYYNHNNSEYYANVGLKCSIPLSTNLPMTLSIRRYQDRNYYSFFPRLFNMLAYKLEKNPELKDNTDFEVYDETQNNIIESKVEKMVYKKSYFNIEKFNEQISKTIEIPKEEKYSNEYVMYDNIINKKIQSWFNHRYSILDKKKVWNYMMEPFYEEYIKNSIYYYEIAKFINLDEKNKLMLNYENEMQMDKISIVNMIIFGKTNINQNILERILPLIRYNNNLRFDYTQLDNYVILQKNGDHNSASYEIIFKDDNLHELQFVNNDEEKRRVVRGLLKLMNEVNPEYLNFNNYYQLSLWEFRNDMIAQLLNNKKENYISENLSYNNLMNNLSNYKSK